MMTQKPMSWTMLNTQTNTKKKGKHLDPKFKNKSKEPCLFLENWNTMQKIAEIKSNQRMREI